MSWQTYVDDHLMCDIEGNHLTSAAILGHDGSVWAQSASFPKFKPEEIIGIMKDLDEPGFLAPTGLYLGGTKYMVIQGEPGAVIRGKKNSKMPREESENGRDDMLIDGCEPEQPRGNSVPDGFNTNYLKVYYGKLFPHHDIFKWMSYGNDGKHPACNRSYFGRREFSFTLDNDIYLRFQSFNSASELENSINEKCPVKIDIGPVYNVDVRFVYFIFAPAKA